MASGGGAPRSRTTRVGASRCSAGSTASRYGRPPRAGVAVEATKTVMAFAPAPGHPHPGAERRGRANQHREGPLCARPAIASLHGVTTGADKLVSLFEPSAQILRRGKLHRPTEFGALVKIQETEGGIVTEVGVVDGKNDAPLLVPAVEGHGRVFGRPPGLVAGAGGFSFTDRERRGRGAVGPHPAGPQHRRPAPRRSGDRRRR